MPIKTLLLKEIEELNESFLLAMLEKMRGTSADIYYIQELFVKAFRRIKDLEDKVKKLEGRTQQVAEHVGRLGSDHAVIGSNE